MEDQGNEVINYSFERISAIDINLVADFSCGRDALDDKLKQMREDDEGTTYVLIDLDNNKIIGYCTYTTSGLRLSYEKDKITQPAVEIKYFAISKDYQHKSYEDDLNFSDYMICKIIERLIEISEEIISFRYILLYSVPEAINFYKKNGFSLFKQFMSGDTYNYIDGCVPMFYALW